MEVAFAKTFALICLIIGTINLSNSSSVDSHNLRTSTDRIVIGNRVANPPSPGSKLMTNQDALIVKVPKHGILLESIELYYSALNNSASSDSRLFIKSADSCTGGAAALSIDTFTIGTSNSVTIDTGWNKYLFDPPLEINFDTLYIWPDYSSGPLPRVEYAKGNNVQLHNLNNFLCASPQFGISPLDYRCELFFRDQPDCQPFLSITSIDSTCYLADTIIIGSVIDNQQMVSFLSRDLVILDTLSEVKSGASLTIDMTYCK